MEKEPLWALRFFFYYMQNVYMYIDNIVQNVIYHI